MTGGRGSPAEVVCALLAAIAEGRTADVLALADPQVVCITGTRPALTRYDGQAGMIRLVDDLRAVYGRYRVEATPVATSGGTSKDGPGAAAAGTRVVVRMSGVRETDGGKWRCRRPCWRPRSAKG
jgi:pyruvate/2-oxoglutarate/acetoin dehydrogenase E1 component